MPIRLMLFRAFVQATVCYGGEILGGGSSRARGFDGTAARCLQRIFGVGSISHHALRVEARIPSVHAMWTAGRIRLLGKYAKLPASKSWLSCLIAAPSRFGFLRHTRSLRTQTWNLLQRAFPASFPTFDEEVSPAWLALWISRLASLRSTSTSLAHVLSCQGRDIIWKPVYNWLQIRGSLKHPVMCIRALFRMRFCKFRTARVLAETDRLSPLGLFDCPFCMQPSPETLQHMFFECQAFCGSARLNLLTLLRSHGGTQVLELITGRISDASATLAPAGSLLENHSRSCVDDSRIIHAVLQFLDQVVPVRYGLLRPLLNNHRVNPTSVVEPTLATSEPGYSFLVALTIVGLCGFREFEPPIPGMVSTVSVMRAVFWVVVVIPALISAIVVSGVNLENL